MAKKYTDITEIEKALAEFDEDDLIVNTYREGHIYKGQSKDNYRHGIGVFIWPNKKAKYTGEFKNDMRNGFGRLVHSENSIYEGYWKND